MKTRVLIAVLSMVAGCANKEASVASQAAPEPEHDKAAAAEGAMAPPSAVAPVMDMAEEAAAKDDSDGDRRGATAGGKGRGPGGDGAAAPDRPSRSWFPETFLFAPLVVTDAKGEATVPVTIPDRLTTYRILALAHSRGGAQAGAVAQLTSSLPVYVEPVVPVALRVGDVVRIPVQVVNTSEAAVSRRLTLTATGATLAGGSGAVTVAARSSTVVTATLTAARPGSIRLEAVLDGTDGVVRTIDVVATGKPTVQTVTGTLAAPRTRSIVGAASAAPGSDRARLEVFPGALAILRTELGASIGRGGVADDAFALLLAGRGDELLRSLGDEPDPVELRRLRILASQRVIRHAVTLDAVTASLIADAALAHPVDPVLSNLGARAIKTIADSQRPDGSCGGENGWTLQRLLVATADCARAARSSPSVLLRASGAIERNAAAITDGYTAAAVLAGGAASGQLAGKLRAVVVAALRKNDDGSQSLPVADGVVRGDGIRPGEVEATALAVLALAGDPQAPLADLGATVLGGYSPGRGWGDGRANLVAMTAVLTLFKDPMPASTRIVLRLDDKVVAEGALGRDQIRGIVTLDVPAVDASGAHTWTVAAEPAVPGLGFSLAVTSWGPWPAVAASSGANLEVLVPPRLQVGTAAELRLRALAPAGQPLTVMLALPAGVQVDTVHLDQQVESKAVVRYQAMAGAVELTLPPLAPGQASSLVVRVVPTLAGTVHSGASLLRAAGAEVASPPARWVIGG